MKNRLEFIAKRFSNHHISLSKDNNLLEIFNPYGGENITVEYVPDDEWTPYILYFAFQHWHLNDEEDIIEHIIDIVEGNIFSIEFFENDIRRFGGDIEAQELQELSYETLEQYTGYYGITKLKEIIDSFKVRGWKTDANFDAKLIIDEFGNVTIQKFLLLSLSCIHNEQTLQ